MWVTGTQSHCAVLLCVLERGQHAVKQGLPRASSRSGQAQLLCWQMAQRWAGVSSVLLRVWGQHLVCLTVFLQICLQCYTSPLSFSPPLAQTLYTVKAEILPPTGTELCRTGSLCALEVSITRLSDLLEVDRDEALTESDEYFSTKLMYEGRSRGFFLPNCCADRVCRVIVPSLSQSALSKENVLELNVFI